MPGLLDRLGKAAQQTAAAAQQATAEGKIWLDISRLNGRLGDRAKAIGYLVFREHQGEEIPEEEYTAILQEMTEIQTERQAKEREMEEIRTGDASSPESSAPAPEASEIICECGTANPAGAKFCSGCGNPLSGE
jgi:hypothetical protein